MVFCLVLYMRSNNQRRVLVVEWKKINAMEIFSSLKNFCDSHPHYNYNTLNNYLSKKKTAYNTEEIRIERKPVMTEAVKPELPKNLFWEFDYHNLDWMRSYRTVMERVIERGSSKDWESMIEFYGRDKVIQALTNDIPYLTDHGVKSACQYFQLSPQELKCYTKKQLQK